MGDTSNTWKKESGYIWSMLGSAVGFANILSFSAQCYKNGGGAFLIPYFLAYLIVGLPMLFLEGMIGQKTKLPLVSALAKITGSKGKILGWLSVVTCATIGGFYIVLTGYAVAYTYFSAAGTIPADTAFFFKHVFLQDSGSIVQFGGIAFAVFISTLFVVLISWAVLTRNIQSGIEKLCSLFLPLLVVLIVTFMIAVCFLPGASIGFKNYILPNFSALSNGSLWRDVFGQLFFSLSLGLGIVIGYSRHNPSSFNIKSAMIKVALGDFLISFMAGFVIFGCMGFMSHCTGISLCSLVISDSAFEIGFVIFPTILAQFGNMAKVIGPIFFFCVFIAGITGVFSIVESVAGNLEIEFQKSRKASVALAMLLITMLAIPFCMGNGQHLLGAMAPMVLGNAMLVGGIGEIVFFLWISNNIRQDPFWRGARRYSLSFYIILILVLPMLTISLLSALWNELSGEWGAAEAIRWSWLLITLLTGYILARKKPSLAKLQKV